MEKMDGASVALQSSLLSNRAQVRAIIVLNMLNFGHYAVTDIKHSHLSRISTQSQKRSSLPVGKALTIILVCGSLDEPPTRHLHVAFCNRCHKPKLTNGVLTLVARSGAQLKLGHFVRTQSGDLVHQAPFFLHPDSSARREKCGRQQPSSITTDVLRPITISPAPRSKSPG